MQRCHWAGEDPQMIAYHDHEWGVPIHDDQALFELLILEGAQAGLSWSTILRKRENYRAAFDRFDASKMARYGEPKIARLLSNPGIVRNRLKIAAAIQNARAYVLLLEKQTFDNYVWSFVGGRAIQNHRRNSAAVPASTKESCALSKCLASRGFRFVGSTICYAFMQSAGLVNDHLVKCFRYPELSGNSVGPVTPRRA